MRKFCAHILALTLTILMTASSLMAQTPSRVSFARGRNSATVTGTLGASAARSYVLRVKSGQTITATLSSTNGKVDFTQGQVHDTQYSITTDSNGDYYIDIDNHGSRSTKYTLTISIQ